MLKKFKIVGFLSFIFVISLSSSVHANPIIPEPSYKSFLFDLIFDIAVIVLVFLILKILKKIPVLKLILYIAVVYINGLLCDFISVLVATFGSDYYYAHTNWLTDFIRQNGIIKIVLIAFFVLLSAFILFITNYFYAKLILKQDKKKSILIGLIIAVFTNPIVGAIINFNDSLLFYVKLLSGRL